MIDISLSLLDALCLCALAYHAAQPYFRGMPPKPPRIVFARKPRKRTDKPAQAVKQPVQIVRAKRPSERVPPFLRAQKKDEENDR